MRLRPKRLAWHLGAVALLSGAAVVWTGGPGSAADATRPGAYGGDATASAIHFLADRNPQPTPVSDAFHAELPYATSSMDSSGSATASAATLYPGGGFLGLAPLLCQFDKHFCGLPLPRYPFMATADYPTTKDDSADAAPQGAVVRQPPLTVEPNVAVAHADADRVEARTTTGTAGVDNVVTAGSATTLSKQTFDGGALVLTAQSILRNVDIAGQLHIDQLTSNAVTRVAEGRVAKSTAVTTITGATAGGQAVTIDSTGIHVGPSGDGGLLGDNANKALAALDASGIKVRLLTPTKKTQTGDGAATCGGLLVTFNRAVALPAVPVPNAPQTNGLYTGSVTLAGAGVAAFANAGDGANLVTIGVPGIGAPSAPAAGPGALPGAPPAAAGTAPVAPSDAAPALAGPAPKTAPASVLGIDLTGKRLKTLALVLMGYPLIVLLTAPLRAPARLPRA